MTRIAIDDTPYSGTISRPAASARAVSPTCTRCGTSLAGRGEPTERFLDRSSGLVATVWRWRCGCGRARTLRKLETPR